MTLDSGTRDCRSREQTDLSIRERFLRVPLVLHGPTEENRTISHENPFSDRCLLTIAKAAFIQKTQE